MGDDSGVSGGAGPSQGHNPLSESRQIVDASARPSKAAAQALRVHPNNALHSRAETLSDLFVYCAELAKKPEFGEYTMKLASAAATLAKLMDGRARGIAYEGIDLKETAMHLSQVQMALVMRGRVHEVKPIAAALLVISEFLE